MSFTEELSSPEPAATHENGTITLSEAGVYRLTYTATPSSVATPVSVSIATAATSTCSLYHNGTQLPSSVVDLPVLNVNIPLVLTVRVPLQGGSFGTTTYLEAQAGDTISFASELAEHVPAADTTVTLSVERIA